MAAGWVEAPGLGWAGLGWAGRAQAGRALDGQASHALERLQRGPGQPVRAALGMDDSTAACGRPCCLVQGGAGGPCGTGWPPEPQLPSPPVHLGSVAAR